MLPPPPGTHREDAGFTLVETIIALVLMGTLMSALGVLFLGAVRGTGGLQRRQAAVQLVGQALEAARAVSSTVDANGCVKLLQGRTRAAVDSQWAAAPGYVTSGTDEAWMPSGCSGPSVLPLTGLPGAVLGTAVNPVVLGNQPYTVQLYIGTCRQAVLATACVRAAGALASAATMYRITARVTWGGSGCTGTCDYSASTLVDTSPDPIFNVRSAAPPVAVPDLVCLPSGGPATVDIVANDTGSLADTPVTVVTRPTKGTLAASISSGVGAYTPSVPANPPATDSFTYRVSDVNGVMSAPTTVTIKIGGCP